MRIRKAIIPVAGLGTRFLPITKAVPKELLPIVDVPMLQLVVDEALDAGITEIILVTGRGKGALEDYFDHAHELERSLSDRGQTELLSTVEAISNKTRLLSVRQKQPLGLGHAVQVAEAAAGGEPVAVLLPDDLFDAEGLSGRSAIGQLCRAFEATGGGAILAVEEVPAERASSYGVVLGRPVPESPALGPDVERLQRLTQLVEKPPRETLPPVPPGRGYDIISGRYVLPAAVWPILRATRPGRGGEIQLTDALAALLDSGHPCFGYRVAARHFDGGNKLGWLTANLHYALRRPDLGPQLRAVLAELTAATQPPDV